MARTKSRAIQVYPDIEAPSKHPTALQTAQSALPNGRQKDRRSLLENTDYSYSYSCVDGGDETDHEDNSPRRRFSPIISPRSYPAFQSNHEKRLRNFDSDNSLSCPNCHVSYNSADLQQYRDHVESCVRPGLAESDDESATSLLSTPPASVGGRDPSLPTAYSLTEVEIYPERREVEDDEDALPEIRLAKITEVEEFGENLADCENLPVEEHYRRILNAQQALTEYQEEWVELEKCVKPYRFPNTISIEEEQERDRGKGRGAAKEVAKPTQKVVNPRALPVRSDDPEKWFYTDDFQLLQDRLEASVYGYVVKEGTKDIGHQDPISQRPRRVGQNQRDLRARIPTQKSAQGELAEESGEENRTLNLVNDALLVEGGRGKREKRPSTRVASESRGSTPVPARGRPPRKNAKIRLQEIEADPTAGETMESTEQWVDNVGDVGSRPGTSSGSATGPSSAWNTDDEDLDREHVVKRKRQDTSDFEAAKKGKKAKIVDADASIISSKADAEAIAKDKSTKRSEGAKMGWAKRKAEQQHRASTRATSQDENEIDDSEQRDRAAGSIKIEGDNQAKTASKAYIKKGKKEPIYTTLPDGTVKKVKSAATINMERRWAKKREAEALGLEPPKIGRYKKSELEAMKAVHDGHTPENTADNMDDVAVTDQKLAGKKRKHLGDEGAADERATEQNESVQVEGKPSNKRRKKNVEHPETESHPTTIPSNDSLEPEDGASGSFNGVKLKSGRKVKKAPVDATMHTPGSTRRFPRVYDPESSLGPTPSLNVDEQEKFEDSHESITPAYPPRRSTARNSAGQGKKGMNSNSFGGIPKWSEPLGPFSAPRNISNKRNHVTFVHDNSDGFMDHGAPSGARSTIATSSSASTTKALSAHPRRSPEHIGDAETILPSARTFPAKRCAGRAMKTPAFGVERRITRSIAAKLPAKEHLTYPAKSQVTPKEEALQKAEAGPVAKQRRITRVTGSSATLDEQISDLTSVPPPAQNSHAGRAKKSPVAPTGRQVDALSIISNPNPADQFAVPEIPRNSIPGRRQVSDALSSQENGSFATPGPTVEEPLKNESGSGSSVRPKRNRHPPNKYQVELDETPSTTRHIGQKSDAIHQSMTIDTAPRNTSFITYEAPEDSLLRNSTKKHKAYSRPKFESPAASIEYIETQVRDTKSTDPEISAAAKAKEAARAAKSEKMKAITKARWASGEMEAVMARKKANNAAKKAAEAANPGTSSKKDKKIRPKAKSPKPPKRRQTLGNTEMSDNKSPSLVKPPFTTGRKMSEYEQFQALTSPSASGSPLPPRGRRPAALRASQSFSQYDNEDDNTPSRTDEPEATFEEEVEKQINRQFASEYDHYQALASPESTIVLGKRARRPVLNLREAMAIEAADEDDSLDD